MICVVESTPVLKRRQAFCLFTLCLPAEGWVICRKRALPVLHRPASGTQEDAPCLPSEATSRRRAFCLTLEVLMPGAIERRGGSVKIVDI